MSKSVKEKVNRLGRIGQIISVILIIGASVSLVCNIGLCVSGVNPHTDPIELLIWILVMISCVGAIVAYCLMKWVADGFRRCDSPFESDVIRRMSVFAWILLAVSILSQAGSILSSLQTVRVAMPSLSGDKVFLWSILRQFFRSIFPGFGIVLALFMLFLVRIFRYGAQLQKEADETL